MITKDQDRELMAHVDSAASPARLGQTHPGRRQSPSASFATLVTVAILYWRELPMIMRCGAGGTARVVMIANPGAGIAGAAARSRIGAGVRARRCA